MKHKISFSIERSLLKINNDQGRAKLAGDTVSEEPNTSIKDASETLFLALSKSCKLSPKNTTSGFTPCLVRSSQSRSTYLLTVFTDVRNENMRYLLILLNLPSGNRNNIPSDNRVLLSILNSTKTHLPCQQLSYESVTKLTLPCCIYYCLSLQY